MAKLSLSDRVIESRPINLEAAAADVGCLGEMTLLPLLSQRNRSHSGAGGAAAKCLYDTLGQDIILLGI